MYLGYEGIIGLKADFGHSVSWRWVWTVLFVALLACLMLLRLDLPPYQLFPLWFRTLLDQWRGVLMFRIVHLSLPAEHEGLLCALLLGIRDGVLWEVRDLFARTGAAHVLALSGMHLGILFWGLHVLLQRVLFLAWARALLSVLIVLLLWLFVGLTGFSTSLVRASVMMSLFVFSQWRLGGYASWHSWFMAFLLILLFDPGAFFSIGFQLSFAAVAGILLFYAPLSRLFVFRLGLLNFVWRGFCVSLAAQAGSIPLSVFYFHTFSVSALFLSPLYVMLTWLVLYTGLLSLLYSSCGTIVSGLMSLLLGIMREVSVFPLGTVQGLHLSFWGVVLLYVGLLCLLPLLRVLCYDALVSASLRCRRALRLWPFVVAAVLSWLSVFFL